MIDPMKPRGYSTICLCGHEEKAHGISNKPTQYSPCADMECDCRRYVSGDDPQYKRKAKLGKKKVRRRKP